MTSRVKQANWVRVTIAAIVLAAFGATFLLAQSAYWVNHSLFNQQHFSSTVTEVITSEPSRQALAESVVDGIFADRPVADRLLGERATSLVSSVLGTDLAENAISGVASRLYAYLTTPDRQDVAVELTSIKAPLSGIISFVENRGTNVNFDTELIPDRIVLLEATALPDLSTMVRQFLLYGLFFWLGTIALFAGYVFFKKDRWRRRAMQAVSVIAGVSVLGLFSGPFLPGIVATFLNNINLRPIAENLTRAFLAPFAAQLVLSLVLAVIALAILFFWPQLVRFGTMVVKSIKK